MSKTFEEISWEIESLCRHRFIEIDTWLRDRRPSLATADADILADASLPLPHPQPAVPEVAILGRAAFLAAVTKERAQVFLMREGWAHVPSGLLLKYDFDLDPWAVTINEK